MLRQLLTFKKLRLLLLQQILKTIGVSENLNNDTLIVSELALGLVVTGQ